MKLFHKSTTTLLLLFLLTLSVAAQRTKTNEKQNDISIYSGYIITANHNDTIYGEIYFQNPVYNESVLIFYKDGQEFIYNPEEGIISEYGFKYEKYNKVTKSNEYQWFTYLRKLVPKPSGLSGFKEVFVERQIHDEICLYNYYELKTTKINSREYVHNYFVEKQGTQGFKILAITRENYMEMITKYLILDNNDIQASSLDYGSIVNLVVVQNAWLSGNPEYSTLVKLSKNISMADTK